MVIMKNNIVKDSFVAISDFHGYEYPLEKVKDYYLNEYDKIFILGDATDRGPDGQGAQGIDILKEIKRLTEQYPGRVVYIPGNHDTFAYDYGKYQDQEIRYFLESYHGKKTVEAIDHLRETNPEELNDLMNWLGQQPLQVRHNYNGQKFALAHAFFNQNVYEENPNLTLEDVYRVHKNQQGSKQDRAYQAILWYRKGQESSYGDIDILDVPVNVIMVIGHTPERSRVTSDLSLTNRYGGKIPVFCVDGGIANGGKMIKYDGGCKYHYTAVVVDEHVDTSPKSKTKTIDTNTATIVSKIAPENFELLSETVAESTARHGIEQAKTIMQLVCLDAPDWYIPVSRGHREQMKNLGTAKVKDMIQMFSQQGDGIEDTVDRAITAIYMTNESFKAVIDCLALEYNLTPESILAKRQPLKLTQLFHEQYSANYEKKEPDDTRLFSPFYLATMSRQPQPYSVRKEDILQDDLSSGGNSQQEVPKILIKRAPQPYGMTRENIIQDDLNA